MPLPSRAAMPFLAPVLALMILSVPAAAAPKRISGKLSKPGYTVIALAADGKAKAVRATPRFKLRPPDRRVSLQLRDRKGVYAGPIVVAKSEDGKQAVVGVKHGAKLGEIAVKPRKGYARAKDVAEKSLDNRRTARARRGVPIGAGKFGLVRSRPTRRSPPGDKDADGVADPLDIDINGNAVLDRYEGLTVARAAADFELDDIYALITAINADGTVQGRPCGTGPEIDVRVTWPADAPAPIAGKSYLLDTEVDNTPDGLQGKVFNVEGPIQTGCPAAAFVPRVSPLYFLTLRETVNANAPATLPALDQTLATRGSLWIEAGPPRPGVQVELDCGSNPGLSWCTNGGTGRAVNSIIPNSPPRSWPFEFPSCCDGDGDGFGDLRPITDYPQSMGALYSPGATTDQIGTGDILNWRITQHGEETLLPRALPDVFATVPALTSWDDDGSGGDPPTPVSYPVPAPYVGSPPAYQGDPGTYQGFPVAPCPAGSQPPCVTGDVVVTLTFWRPQREAIGNEEGQWTEIGGLLYAPGLSKDYRPPLANCPQSAISTTDSQLTVAKSSAQFGNGYGVRDSPEDREADPSHTFSLSVNLTQCLGGFAQGEEARMSFVASLIGNTTAGYSATQSLLFTRQ